MPGFRTAVIVGSLRKGSFNLKLAKALIKLGEGRFQADMVRIDDLPLFNQDLEANFPAPATRMKDQIGKADGILIVTPEYNRSIPAPLKNAIDWASRPYGENAFADKPVSLAGTSPGSIGSACAQHNLHSILKYLDVRLMGQPEVYLQFKEGLIDDDGNISNDKTREFLNSFINKFVAWVEKTR
jgi:chromate reductase